MIGEFFTVAEIMVSHTLNWAQVAEVPLSSPVTESYLERIMTTGNPDC